MPNKVSVSKNAFLLFSKLVIYIEREGKGNKKYSELNSLLKGFAEEINEKIRSENRIDFLSKLSVKVENLHGSLNPIMDKTKRQSKSSFYQKFLNLKNGDIRGSFGFNTGSPLHHFFDSYILLNYSTHHSVQNGIKGFCENYLQSFFTSTSDGSKENSPSIEEDISGTTWYFYYHEYDDGNSPYSIISRLILQIDSKTTFRLFDKEKKGDFVPAKDAVIIDGTSSIMIINLEREHKTIIKRLELRIIISGAITENSIFLGQYMDFETGDRLVSGTFVIQNITSLNEEVLTQTQIASKINEGFLRQVDVNQKKYNVAQVKLTYNTQWQKYIPIEIAKYLCNKWKNFTKTNSTVSNIEKLASFQSIQNNKPFSNPKFNAIIEFDAMLVTPGFDDFEKDSAYYHDINNAFFEDPDFILTEEKEALKIYEANDFFKKINVHRIFFPQRDFKIRNPIIKKFRGNEEPKVMLEHYLSVMQSSRAVFLILPEKICSSTIIMVGWAIQMEKLVFVFPTKEDVLPRLISKDYKTRITVSGAIEIGEIPKYIQLNGGMFLNPEV